MMRRLDHDPPDIADDVDGADFSVIIVSYGHGDPLVRAVRSALSCRPHPREVIVVENGTRDPRTSELDGLPDVRVVASTENRGFAGGANDGAAIATGAWLLFLNPDAQAEPDLPSRLFGPMSRDAAIVGAQLLLPDGSTNAGDNPVHISGLSWSGRLGLPPEAGPARRVHAVSGACLAVRATAFEQLGGFDEDFFLYCEDTDLCVRALVDGHAVVFAPDARATHDYEFSKGTGKWFYLERNRLTMLATIPERRTLLRLAPALVAVELAIIAGSIHGGWTRQKFAAYGSLIRRRRSVRRRRAAIQGFRTVSDTEVWRTFTWNIDSPILSGRGVDALNAIVGAYGRLARWERPGHDA